MSTQLLDETASGVYIISATPFKENGELDLESADRLVDFYIEKGVSGITILGVMGEAQKMAPEESEAFLERVLWTTRCRLLSVCPMPAWITSRAFPE